MRSFTCGAVIVYIVPEVIGSDGAYTASSSMDVRSGSCRVNFRVSVFPLSVTLVIVQPLFFLSRTKIPLLSLGKPKILY